MQKAFLMAVRPINFQPDSGDRLDYTEFHLATRLGGADGFGVVTQPYRFGTSKDAELWPELRDSRPDSLRPLPVEVDIDLVSDGKGKSRVQLLSIKRLASAKAGA